MQAVTINVAPSMTMEEFQQRRLEARRAKNREAAAESRRRIKQKIQALENRLEKTEVENEQLRALLNCFLQQQVHLPIEPASYAPQMNSMGQQQPQALPNDTFNPYDCMPMTNNQLFQHSQEEEYQIPRDSLFPSLEFAELSDEDLLALENLQML